MDRGCRHAIVLSSYPSFPTSSPLLILSPSHPFTPCLSFLVPFRLAKTTGSQGPRATTSTRPTCQTSDCGSGGPTLPAHTPSRFLSLLLTHTHTHSLSISLLQYIHPPPRRYESYMSELQLLMHGLHNYQARIANKAIQN
jgi:hypothetical protein